MTQCNLCRLKSIREHAKRSGERVTVFRLDSGKTRFSRSVEVFVYPKNVKPHAAKKALLPTGERRYFAAWFAEMPDTCRCGG